jgi:pimeloyl-ACP methyl ester carboxylesterase
LIGLHLSVVRSAGTRHHSPFVGSFIGRNMGARRFVCIVAMLAALTLPAAAADKLGIVLMHGKEGLPGRMLSLSSALSAAGFLVERPEMCWSRRRIYDRMYLDCLTDADAAADKLKAEGATGIVIAGIGLGGQAALAYGARRDGLKGVIALAPGPPVEFFNQRSVIAKSLAEAQAMIAAGRGDESAVFADILLDRFFEVETTARIYASFFASDSPGVMPDNSSKLKAPLLVVSGTFDPSQRSIPYVFARAPSRALNWHVTVPADRRGTAGAARDVILAWLRLLAAQ